ncbi:MAG: hypothetical protein WCL18_04770 [bacterium]
MIEINKDLQIIQSVGIEAFDYITTIPETQRKKGGDEGGVHIMLRILWMKGMVHVLVNLPSPLAHDYAVEKSVRTEIMEDVTSQDSEDTDIFHYRGCVSYKLPDGTIIHCAVSGLFGTEDVTIAIIVMAKKLGVTVDDVINNIKQRSGSLPEEIFQEGHYLKVLLDTYR